MRFIQTIAIGLVLQSSVALSVENLKVDSNQSTVEFLAKGSPGFLKIRGKEGKIGGNLTLEGTALSGELTTDLNLFKTGIDLRDTHMKEKYLETGKFQNATIKFANQTVNLLTSDKQQLKALLTLHGITKPITIDAEIKKVAEAKYDVESSFKIILSDYSIDVPKYLGVTVAEDVVVETRLHTGG